MNNLEKARIVWRTLIIEDIDGELIAQVDFRMIVDIPWLVRVAKAEEVFLHYCESNKLEPSDLGHRGREVSLT